ncbi:MAG: hypothetical protein HJJLKODD_00035 [Phycisphaerae bacterium]|nr:hypothetical protein [Phycisphaerae bacterium]
MDYRVHLNFGRTVLIFVGVVAISGLTATLVASRAYQQRGAQSRLDRQEITVKGSARKRIRSDQANWRIMVRGESFTLNEAFEELQRGVACVGEFLKSSGFGTAEIYYGPISTSVHYLQNEKGQETREVESYELWRVVSVSTRQVDRVAAASGEVTEIIGDDIQVQSWAPEFTSSQLADLKVEMVGLAAADARSRAEQLAQNAGFKLNDVRDASMGVLQITRPDSTEVSSGGVYDMETIEKDITAVVNVTFGIGS